MGKPKTYRLKLMVDMFQIPEERFEEFLIDLKKWHSFGQKFNDLVQTIGKAVDEQIPADYMTMRWTDDGIHDGPTKVVIHKPPTPAPKRTT